MARAQLSTLTYSELSELAARFNETAKDIRNPNLRADLFQAAGASLISHLSNSGSKKSPPIATQAVRSNFKS